VPPTTPPPDWVLARRRVIGEHLRAARRQRGLTQMGLAEAAGLDRQAISAIENGYSTPYLDTLILIAAAMDVPLADLMRE
jgi:transcriptional regulator with XRE-family HTH domain